VTGAAWTRRAYAAVLGALAAAVLGWTAADLTLIDPRTIGGAAAGVAVLHAIARHLPVLRRAQDGVPDLTTEAVFGFALLLVAPAPVVVMAASLAAVVPQRRDGAPKGWHLGVEVARTALVYGTAAVVHAQATILLAPQALDPTAAMVLALVPAGLVAYPIDVAIRAGELALASGASIRAVLRQDAARFGPSVHLLLVALAPLVAVVAERSVVLLPLVVVGVVAVSRATRTTHVQHHDALHDQLTGLANRRSLELRLDQLTSEARLRDGFALLLMDLDRFKEVNDQLGHHVGDELLREVGARLAAIDGLDLASRIGGDEFAFVARGVSDHADLTRLAQRMVAEISRPYVVNDVELAIGASIGIARFPDHGLDAASLLRRSDSAMYAAKRSGVAVGFATVSRDGATPGRFSLLGELEDAMRRGHLKLHHQPKVSLRTGEIVGVEALLRWHHPEHGIVPPAAFVTTVEHTELIAPLTRHVLRTACEDRARWVTAGVEVPLAVNVSTRDLQDTRFPRDLGLLLADHDVPADQLTLEITESALQVDADRAQRVIGELEELGVRLAIDDFGTGYSSLAALQRLPVAELKLDRTFVLGMAEGPHGVAIVRSIVQLAHALGLEVVAEGVEDVASLHELERHGCDTIQGFLVSRPLPAHLVAPWVRARRTELAEARALGAVRTPVTGGDGLVLPGRVAAGVADQAPERRPLIRAV
jgi:diguanylate cyclase